MNRILPCGCPEGEVHLDNCRIPKVIQTEVAPTFSPEAMLREFPQVERTLAERGSRYGDFLDNAELSQELEDFCRSKEGYDRLDPLHREALKFIFQKVSRIVNGDPNYPDNWHDIQGYAKLVEDRLPK